MERRRKERGVTLETVKADLIKRGRLRGCRPDQTVRQKEAGGGDSAAPDAADSEDASGNFGI